LVFDPLDLTGAGPALELSPPVLKYPAAGAEVSSGTVPLLGSGSPGAEVQVVVDGELGDVVAVDDGGFWFLSVELTEPGTHTITLRSTTQQGTELFSRPVDLVVVEN
jgi:hypothetical protein